MNHEDFAYTNLVTPDMCDEARSSKLWPLVTGIVSLSEGRLKLTKFTRHDNEIERAYFSIANGIAVLRISRNNEEFKLSLASHDTIPSYNDVARSKNYKIILRRLAEDRTGKNYQRRARRSGDIRDLGNNLKGYLDNLDHAPLHTIVYRLADKLLSGINLNYPNINQYYSQRTMREIIRLIENPVCATREAQDLKDKMVKLGVELDDRFSGYHEDMENSFGKDKWVVISYGCRYVSIGKINLLQLMKTKSTDIYTPTVDMLEKIDIIRPFKMYKSMTQIEPEIADQVLSRLAMDRALLKPSSLNAFAPNNRETDPADYLPYDDVISVGLGFVAYTPVYSVESTKWVMFDA